MTREEYFYHHPVDKTNQILETLIQKYGPDTTLSEAQKSYNEKKNVGYKCPKCGGKGYIVKEYNAYPSGLPDSGWVYKPGYDYQMCDLCKGDGYTLIQYKPKIKTEIVGYEEA